MSSAPYRVDHDRGRYLRGRAQNYIAVFQEEADEQDIALLKNAPELLACLVTALDDLEAILPTLLGTGWQVHNETATIRRGRAVIAKVTGEQP